MKVIKQTPFTESMLVSTNVAEIYPAWSSGTTYAKDAIIYYGIYGIYQSLVNSNLNHQPNISPTQWVRLGPTNARAMFDQTVSTQSISPAPVEVVLDTGVFDSLALINIDCASVQLEVTAGAGGATIYDETVLMVAGVVDWYDYFFSPIEQETQVIFRNIPPQLNNRAILTFTGTGSIKIGEVIFGVMKTIGGTQYGASSGIVDYSKKNTDEFGVTTLVQGAYSKRMQAQVYLLNTELNGVQKFLYSIRATPSVFIGSDVAEFSEALIVYGFYKDFTTEIPYPTHSICSIEIEGLI
jgi:hypothetical protein